MRMLSITVVTLLLLLCEIAVAESYSEAKARRDAYFTKHPPKQQKVESACSKCKKKYIPQNYKFRKTEDVVKTKISSSSSKSMELHR